MSAKSNSEAVPGGIGLGDVAAKLVIHIENRPPLTEFEQLDHVRPMMDGEIAHIAQAAGNHWRKIFNVFAKLVAEWRAVDGFGGRAREIDWRHYRDRQLLQSGSGEALLFTPPRLGVDGVVNIISGKGYAESLGFPVDQGQFSGNQFPGEFALFKSQRLIVAPYLDYRQLSDVKIRYLCQLMASF